MEKSFKDNKKLYKSLSNQYKNLKNQSIDPEANLRTIKTAIEENLKVINEQINNDDFKRYAPAIKCYRDFKKSYFDSFNILFSICITNLLVLIPAVLLAKSLNLSLLLHLVTIFGPGTALSAFTNYFITKHYTKIDLKTALKGRRFAKEEDLNEDFKKLKKLFEDLEKNIGEVKVNNNIIEDSYFLEISKTLQKIEQLKNKTKKEEFINRLDRLKDYYENAILNIRSENGTLHTDAETELKSYLIRELSKIELELAKDLLQERRVGSIQEDATIVEEQITQARGK